MGLLSDIFGEQVINFEPGKSDPIITNRPGKLSGFISEIKTIPNKLSDLFYPKSEPKSLSKQTGPGFDGPMLQPGSPGNPLDPPVAYAKDIPTPQAQAPDDPFIGYNKNRGPLRPDMSSLILNTAQKYQLDPSLIAAIIFNESGFNPKARNQNRTGSIDRGIAQINNVAHPNVTDDQADDPQFAVDYLAQILKGNIDYFGDINKAVAAYNAGRLGVEQSRPVASEYLNRVYQNLTPEYAAQLGIRPNLYQ